MDSQDQRALTGHTERMKNWSMKINSTPRPLITPNEPFFWDALSFASIKKNIVQHRAAALHHDNRVLIKSFCWELCASAFYLLRAYFGLPILYLSPGTETFNWMRKAQRCPIGAYISSSIIRSIPWCHTQSGDLPKVGP